MTLSDTTQPTGSEIALGARSGEVAIQWIHGGNYGQRLVLSGARVRLGRGSTCHVRLEHPSVSREHAEIYRQGPVHVVRDLGSRNGTHLNGHRVEHEVLSAGDVIRAGELLGVVVPDTALDGTAPFGELAPHLYGGPRLHAALATARAAALTNLPVLIVGATGTGKERFARAIHLMSGRAGKFHAINCSTLPPSIAEAELLGHERGAFTGAERARLGHFRAAHGGTLLLDEIADLPLAVQVKLLRVLQEREVTPIGSTDAVPIDVRVAVAAQEPLERLVEQQRLRQDLFARLDGFRLELPALAARREEIPGLFWHFLGSSVAGPTPTVEAKLLERLCLHAWPGNVRELELFSRKLVAIKGTEPVLKREHAEGLLPQVPEHRSSDGPLGHSSRRDHDRSRLKQALARLNGNMTAAARSVGISRRRAYRLVSTNGSESDAPQEGPDGVSERDPSDGA